MLMCIWQKKKKKKGFVNVWCLAYRGLDNRLEGDWKVNRLPLTAVKKGALPFCWEDDNNSHSSASSVNDFSSFLAVELFRYSGRVNGFSSWETKLDYYFIAVSFKEQHSYLLFDYILTQIQQSYNLGFEASTLYFNKLLTFPVLYIYIRQCKSVF